MPLVQAWQCPQTGKFFADKPAYLKHLRRLGAQRIEAFKQRRAEAEFDDHIGVLRKAGDFGQIVEWCVAHTELLARNTHGKRDKRLDAKTARLWDMGFKDMRWSECIPNTHHAPVGKPRNWNGDPSLPGGYPGWRGNLVFKLANWCSYSSDLFRRTGVHLGSGGGTTLRDEGGKEIGIRCSYRVYLFEEEWPLLALMMKMRGEKVPRWEWD